MTTISKFSDLSTKYCLVCAAQLSKHDYGIDLICSANNNINNIKEHTYFVETHKNKDIAVRIELYGRLPNKKEFCLMFLSDRMKVWMKEAPFNSGFALKLELENWALNISPDINQIYQQLETLMNFS